MVFVIAVARAGGADDMADFNQSLEKFLEQQRIFLNCTALDPVSHGIATGQYEDMVRATLDLLRTYGTPSDIDYLQKKTALEAIVMRDARLWQVMEFCSKNKGWEDLFYKWQFIILQNEASRIFYHRHH